LLLWQSRDNIDDAIAFPKKGGKNMKKKLVALLLAASMVIGLAGCGTSSDSASTASDSTGTTSESKEESKDESAAAGEETAAADIDTSEHVVITMR